MDLPSPDRFADDPTGRPFLSGNGSPGSTNNRFEFWFSILPGDYDQSGRIDAADLAVIGDGDGDGMVEAGAGGDDRVIAETILNTLSPEDNGPTASRSRGDYHDNEEVTSADYDVWKMTYGDVLANEPDGYLEADGNGNGIVDAADYTNQHNHLGQYSTWGDPPAGGGGGPIVQFGIAPQVANVAISGSNSTHAPYSFDAHDGSGEQLRTVPVGGADTISITFSEDVNISADCLQLVGLSTASRPTVAEFSYDLGSMTASWRFENWDVADQYWISLSDTVTDVEGDRLDGEWTNPASIFTTNAAVSEFPSGDGEGGGDFNFVATLLPGDADLNNMVGSPDFNTLIFHYGMNGAEFIDADFNGNGVVDSGDYNLLLENFGANLVNVEVLADLNGDWLVDELDADILFDNWENNLENPAQADGDLDANGDIDIDDLEIAFAQFGLTLTVVS